MKRAYFFLFYLIYSNHVFSDDFGPVFNTGLSKMEMIEKMDQYLSGELRSKIQSLESENTQMREKTQDNFKQVYVRIENMEQSLKRIEDLVSSLETKFESKQTKENTDEKSYLRELKNIVIPALQQKIIGIEKSFEQALNQILEEKKLEGKLKNTEVEK